MRVKVPASIANMGPGFDCLAMAIDLWLEVEAEPAEHSSWDYEGEGADYLAAHVNPFSKLQMKGRVKSAIPLGVGLGSSGAARLAASALMSPWDVTSHTIDASSEEGHADNVAASAKGGLVLVVSDHVHEALPDPGWDLALFLANTPVPTEKARASLPDSYSREDAVFNAARVGLLIKAFSTNRPELLREAMRDRLHQPYRAHLYPWTADVMQAADIAGAYGAAICGAGPSVFAFCPPRTARKVADAMHSAAPREGRPMVTRISEKGMFRSI